MVDCQNTYTRGVMQLEGVQAALDAAEELLDRARSAGTPIVHIMHDGGVGSSYDITTDIGQIVPRVAPRAGETVIVKHYPNSFVDTELDQTLQAIGHKNLLVVGFMTHMCVNSTTRGAFSLGYRPTVVASATATRNLPTADAGSLQVASLAALADLFGVVVPDVAAIPD